MNFPDKPGVRTGGFSYPGTLRIGGAAFGGPPSVRMQVGFYDPRDERQRPAGLYSVQFNVDTSKIADPKYKKVNPVATVRWSVEGNTIQRRLSVVNGTTVTGVCDAVEVVIVDETDDVVGPVPPGTALDYDVTISVVPYPRPSSGSPPILRGNVIPITVAGGAGPVAVPVPDDAGVNSVMVLTAASVGAIPTVSQQHGTLPDTFATWTPEGAGRFVPLLPQAGRISLDNLGAPATTVDFTVLFGIDG